MPRSDFPDCSDEQIRAAIYEAASKKATKYERTAKKQVERQSKTDQPGKFSFTDMEDWFVMAIAKQFELEELFPELFETPLGFRLSEAWFKVQSEKQAMVET